MDTYEKKYKEALEWARKVMQGKVGFVLDDVLEKFPELKESEDERIRKRIIQALHGDVLEMSEIKEAVDWLEKRGEQKSSWSEEDEYCRHQLIVFCENCMVPDSGAIKCANWLKSLKDKVQPKQEWSEEDEAHLYSLITHLEQWIKKHPNTTGADVQGENIAWLKSLKDRATSGRC